jgi:glycine cleavage system aminomethyltransferase T
MASHSTSPGASPKSLETCIEEAGGPVALLRGSNIGPYVFPVIPPEFTNWRDEMRAWKESCALLEQSYHMTELHLRGPAVIPFLSELATNRFDPYPVKRAKQLVLAGHDGYFVADGILFHEEEEFFRLVGAPFASDWVQFNAENTDHDVEVKRDDNYVVRVGPRDVFRIQIQGPQAFPLMREVADGSLPDIKFFDIGEFRIAGHAVRALRHGMAGELGYEIYGPWDVQQAVREALEKTGEKHGLRKVGALAYSTTGTQSGWMPMPLPAIYHSAEMKPYREWLKGFFLEILGSLGGSFVSDDIVDYYVDPVELGYKQLIDFNHDFIGREALRDKVDNQRRAKVSFAWNSDDVMAIIRSSLAPDGPPGKYIAQPNPMYATFESDAVVKNGEVVGISQWSCHTPNADTFMSLGVVNVELAEPGTDVTLLWGEPDSKRRTVEKHEVREVRAKVAPAPFFEKVIKSGKQ